MALNTDKLKAYGKLKMAIKKLETKTKELKEKAGEMEGGLIDHMLTEGLDKISIRGANGLTLFISSTLWESHSSKEDAIEALREAGLGSMVEEGFNSQRLSAYLRELDKEGQELPDAFKGKIRAVPTQKLQAKRR